MVRSTLLHLFLLAGPTGKKLGFNISRDIDYISPENNFTDHSVHAVSDFVMLKRIEKRHSHYSRYEIHKITDRH